MQVLLANPRGFCAGVDRAIHVVEQALQRFGTPVYVRHEIVHNKFVVNDLKQRGVIFVDQLSQVPDGAVVIFSAHGVAKAVYAEAAKRELSVIDATCPLVSKVHHQVDKYCRVGYEIIMIGHPGHVEVLGTIGQVGDENRWRIKVIETVADVARLQVNNPGKLAYVTQTTLSVDDTKEIINALRTRFPRIVAPAKEDICYATQNRQEAIKTLTYQCDVILVVGSKTSSNSNSLKDLSLKRGTPAYLIDGPEDIQSKWLSGKKYIGVTAGASAPEVLIKSVVDRLEDWGATDVQEMQWYPENINFRLPKMPQRSIRLAIVNE
jgi:4-hydroxy-3-methylbut-2-en-1-yl diphosphate reductase